MDHQKKNWWKPTRIFIATLILILILSITIVFLIHAKYGNSLWIDILLALAVASFVAIFVHIADRLVFLREVTESVTKTLTSSLDERIIRNPVSSGIVGIHTSLQDANFASLIGASMNMEICILDTYIPDALQILKAVEKALKQGCMFKFLVLDSASDQAKDRARLLASEGLGEGNFKDGTNLYTCQICSVAYNNNALDKISVRYYSEPPTTPIYIFRSLPNVDSEIGRDKLFFGFYMDKTSYSSFHLEVARIGEQLYEMLEDYFFRMWERNGKDLDLETYLKNSCPTGLRKK